MLAREDTTLTLTNGFWMLILACWVEKANHERRG